jgi:hypothetical protein
MNPLVIVAAPIILGFLAGLRDGHDGGIAAIAVTAANRWSGVKEDSPQGKAMIAQYWREGGRSEPNFSAPWSGVFISWAANKADSGSLLHTAAHSAYVRAGMGAQVKVDPSKYSALPGKTPVKVGDIIVKFRGDAPRDPARLLTGEQVDSHGDIVVSVKDGKAIGIGGNKKDDVSSQEYNLNASGAIAGRYGVFAVMRLGANL